MPGPRIITFDIETRNQFSDVGSSDPAALDISLVGVHDSGTGEYTSYLLEELPLLWKLIEETDILVGYNSDHFDIPLLNKYYPGDLTRIKSIDIMKEIQAVLGRRLRLDAVAEGTLGANKSGNGLEALKWWKDGEIEKIRTYCLKDVELTRKLFDYAMANGKLKYKELGKTKEVALDTSRWLAVTETGALTQTLGF
ncbi:MAG TPA: ribonuclease H-like domain-containing protein [Candidatus Paceibacterota bacterium]|nr:ribonuclease H-like domain-containing protein [Candidatus Paceibacterota bacterium]